MVYSSKTPTPPQSTESTRQLGWQRWKELAGHDEYSAIASWMLDEDGKEFLDKFFSYSPYLTKLALNYPFIIHDVLSAGPDGAFRRAIDEITLPEKPESKYTSIKYSLRIAKHKVALITAIADVTRMWPLKKITRSLSEFAQTSLQFSLDTILHVGEMRGEITLKDASKPAKNSGIIVLAMGKLGGHELNYSSDIDLIIFFRRDHLNYTGKQTEQHFMNRVAQDLVQIMQDRTAEGYVFRTDLRLRPDPASTPPAITTTAAYYYYESVGQNWERAAMIKARPVAGDMPAAKEFLEKLAPFMWRRSLDFAAINDIHSIKRQMDSKRNAEIHIRGHNVKLGVGGIREIEFFAQIFQLIWGGREKILRTKATRTTLRRLQKQGLIEKETYDALNKAYIFLRTIEHRLQMVADEQTHTMPESDEGLEKIAGFMGYANIDSLRKDFFRHTRAVHDIYAVSFKSAEKLSSDGNLVFTGVSHDPETIRTLARMGFNQPETVSEVVMGWHHGSSRATRTKQARELLTELMPTLLRRLSETANPDGAVLRFNDFIKNLPAGVQLFSLFKINPQLLELIATILGSAPALSEHLSRSPELLDVVLYDDFYKTLPDRESLMQQLDELVQIASDYEERMNRVRQFRNEKQFQAGVHFLKHMVSSARAGEFLSDLAEVTINYAHQTTMNEFIFKYGELPGGQFGIIALGKLGSREMTFSSDIDLVFVYDVADEEALSVGEKEVSASVYYNRFAQRLLTAITGMGRHGRLYEVDTRLRPSGSKGLLAVSVSALKVYFKDSAWTFEYMALSKARPILEGELMGQDLGTFIGQQLSKKRDTERLKRHVLDMRERIDKEYGSSNIWNIKYVRGGLLDLEFIAQYLLLRYAPNSAPPYPGNTSEIFHWLMQRHELDETTAQELINAERFLVQIFYILRLCTTERFDEEYAPQGLKRLLHETLKLPNFSAVKNELLAIEKQVQTHYNHIINAP